jgi:UDP-glucose 4-epimerase
MRAIVTGGAGFIGSHVVDRLMKEHGVERVLVIDDMRLGNTINVAQCAKEIDVWEESVQRALSEKIADINYFEPDIIFNLAVDPLPKSLILPWETWHNNVDITEAVARYCIEKKIRMVQFSSSEVYGTIQRGRLSECSRFAPMTMYAASKAACDHIISALVETDGLEAVTIRPFNCIGPRQNKFSYAGIVPMTINRIQMGERPVIYGTGKQTRDYTYVTDVANAAWVVATRGETGRVYNACSGTETQIDWLVNEISMNMGYNGTVDYRKERRGDVQRHQGDNNALAYIGWRREVTIRDAVRKTVEWYK